MPKVTVYQCPFTKDYFDTRRKYINHLKRLRKVQRKRRHDKKLARITRKQREAKLNVIMERLNAVRTLPELEQAYLDLFGKMMEHCHRNVTDEDFKMVRFELSSMRYSNSTSNTHACPRSGVTNWGGRTEGAPRGYPGFSGRIEYTVIEPEDFDGWFVDVSNAVGRFGVHTGTGGGRGICSKTGGERYYYDVKIFLDDFPGLAEHVEKLHEDHKRIIFTKKLKGERIQAPVYDDIIG